jgi:hypothetical protein
MTLIARSEINGIPFYTADTLLSSAVEPDSMGLVRGKHKTIAIPAATDINAFLTSDSKRTITGMVQKLNILSDRLIVAWAGSLVQARAMLRDLAALDKSSDVLTDELVREVIEGVPEHERNDLVLIGSISRKDPHGRILVSHFHYRAEMVSEVGEEHVVAGTGRPEFMEFLSDMRPTLSERLKCVGSGQFESVERLGFLAFGHFVGQDIVRGNNLRDWWGGAFEVATFREGSFRKLTESTVILFFQLTESERQLLLEMIPILIKYDYVDDSLFIQQLRGEFSADTTLASMSYGLYLCTPLLGEVPPLTLVEDILLNFKHTTLCCFIIDKRREKMKQILRVFHDSDGIDKISATIDSCNIRIDIDAPIIEALLRDASAATNLPVIFGSTGK